MIADLKPYPSMKDSGVEWLGAVPEHWDLIPNRAALKLKKDVVGSQSDNYILLSLTKQGIIARDMENPEGKFPTSFDSYQVVEPGDLIFCLFDIDETPRAVGLSSLHGMITGAYTRFVCSDPQLREFLYLLYLSIDNGKMLKPLYSGLRKVIQKSTFLSVKFPLPPSSEQAAIVHYLKYVDNHIQRLIRSKKKLIALLVEQKQAIIHQVVTRGLDPRVQTKDSRVEWLSKIPAHWELGKLRRLTNEIGDGLHGTPQYVTASEYFFVNGNNLDNGQIAISNTTNCVDQDEYNKYKVLLDNTTLLMSINGTIGNLAYYSGENIILGKSAAYFRCKSNLKREYLFFLLQSKKVIDFLCSESTGTTIINLSLNSLRRLTVPLPSLKEQLEITRYLDYKLESLNDLILNIEHQVDSIREYQLRLMADVVTGKIDVREIAANLPDDEPEFISKDTIENGNESEISEGVEI